MKRYALFQYWDYYPSGGWNDFVDSFDTPEEARAAAKAMPRADNSDVIDLTTGEEV